MKTFKKEIENYCNEHYSAHRIMKEITIREAGKTTHAAIVSITHYDCYGKLTRLYTIFYKYQHMKKIDKYGIFIQYKNNEINYNAYIDAEKEFKSFL